jgi:hypothetical protein
MCFLKPILFTESPRDSKHLERVKRRLNTRAAGKKGLAGFTWDTSASTAPATVIVLVSKLQKGRPAMSSSPESANPSLPVSQAESSPHLNSPVSADLPYMTMTVVAILLLLGSLWIF